MGGWRYQTDRKGRSELPVGWDQDFSASVVARLVSVELLNLPRRESATDDLNRLGCSPLLWECCSCIWIVQEMNIFAPRHLASTTSVMQYCLLYIISRESEPVS